MPNITTPPPRPSTVGELFAAKAVNEHPAPAVNDHRTLTIKLRWDTLITMLATLIIGIAIGSSVTLGIVTADPYHGVPVCTDQIADAGGICHGEPR